jgi:hypothetical protein
MKPRELLQAEFLAKAVEMGAKNPHLLAKENDAGDTEIQLSDETNSELVRGHISYFPGCCGIAVLHNALNCSDAKWLKWLFEFREAIAAENNKGLCVQTDVVGAQPTTRLMKSLGYRIQTREFFNPNSGNRVRTWAKKISQPEPRKARRS